MKWIVITIVIVALLVSGFYSFNSFIYYQKQNHNPVFKPTIETTKEESNPPYISSPSKNSAVSSPIIVEGVVPAGWMFEGVLPAKLTDSNHNVIVETQALETIPGSWTSGHNVSFKATFEFKTNAKSGYIVIEKDNPSGLPQNDSSYELPVVFK